MSEANVTAAHMEHNHGKPRRRQASSKQLTTSPNSPIDMARQRKAKRDGPLKGLSRWLFDNQTSLSFNLIALLFLTHVGAPSLRPYTVKFFTLSYYNPNSGKYAAGYDDFYLMTFWIVALTGLRAGCMHYVLAPLASRWGASKKKLATRFAEQGWMLIYYSVFWPLGMYIYYKSPYYLNMQELWTDWPQRELDGLMKAYMLGQWSFWIQQVLVINIEDRRKDHWQMLTHHIVTIALISASYAYHQTRVGNLIMVLMDVVDLVFPLAKCLKYLGYTTICDVLFGVFITVWLISRHVFYLITCWSVYSDLPRLTPPACFRGAADDLQGPFPIPDGWSHLLDPFRDFAGTVCFNQNITYGFLMYLLTLQVMMIMWSVFIIRVAVRVIKGKGAEDIRSDEEDEEDMEEEKEDAEQDEARSLKEKTNVEAIDCNGRERRTDMKSAAASSGISLNGHSDPKELLNRIGCEMRID